MQNSNCRVCRPRQTAKKLISLVLSLVMLLTITAGVDLSAYADDGGTCGDNLTWTYDSSTYTLTISGTGNMKSYSTDSYDTAYVTTAPWKRYYQSMKTIVINDGVTSIGNYAFYKCIGLTSATIGNSVTNIGSSAFDSCTGLTSVTIGNSVTNIGSYAFSGCRRLTSVTIPNSVKYIGEGAFYYCTGITNVTILDSVTSIGSYAFYKCTGLTSVSIPNSVTSIGSNAFSGCTELTNIIVDENNIYYSSLDGNLYDKKHTTLIQYAVSKTDTSFIIPNSVKYIGEGAFYFCPSLTDIKIPDSVTSIGGSAFDGCTGLTSVTIPDSVTSIGYSAFENCTGIKALTMPCSVKLDNFYHYYSGEEPSCFPVFDGCSNIEKITLTKGTGTMQNYSEKDTSSDTYYQYTPWYISRNNLKELIIEDGVTYIGNYAFYKCIGLTIITIPETVTNIGSSAFSDCTELTSISLGKGIKSAGINAFSGCSKLKGVAIKDLSTWCNINFGNETANPLFYAKKLYSNGKLITDLQIPNDTTKISNYAFYNCNSLTSVNIPDSVTSIGSSAFYNCTGLTNATVGNGLETVSDNAFYGCSNLKNITLGENVKLIGNSAFFNCTNLNDVTIPNSVTNLGSNAFSGCTGLTNITIPNSVISIGDSAFKDCTRITNVTIPDSVTSIGGSAFYNCSKLSKIVIGSSIDTFSKDTFTFNKNSTLVLRNREFNINSILSYLPSGMTVMAYGSTNIGMYADMYGLNYVTLDSCEEGAHSFEVTNKVPATCIKEGSVTKVCSLCGETVTETLPIVDHTPQVDEAVAPTCTQTGLTEGSHCAVCGKILTAQQVANETGHYYEKIDIAPTCISKGYTLYICKNCHDGYKVFTADATDKHEYKTIVISEPTYYATGQSKTICTVCGKYTVKTLSKLTLSKPTITLTAQSKGFKVSYKKITGATGYEIQHSTSSKFTSAKSVKTTALSKTVTKLTAKKKYYVRVRAYHTESGKGTVYSSWSSTKNVTTKK